MTQDTTPETRELKVTIPIEHHVRLHSVKILTGKQISECITEALSVYLALPENAEVARRAEALRGRSA